MTNDKTLLYVLIGGAAYLLLRPTPPAGSAYRGAFAPTGTQVSGPGFAYRSGPGGTQVAIDPAILRGLFAPSGVPAPEPNIAPPDSPVYIPDAPTWQPTETPPYDPLAFPIEPACDPYAFDWETGCVPYWY